MLNGLLNRIVDAYTTFRMRKYRHYPSATTAILLVNVQKAYLVDQGQLSSELGHLLEMARKYRYLVVHAPFGGSAQTYPSPAQQKLTHLLSGAVNGVMVPDELAPRDNDIVLAPRHTLSAFNQTSLDAVLKAHKIEHLIAVGPYANLSLDSSIRDGVQLGYHLTVLESCITAERDEELKAFKLTIPRYAQTVIRVLSQLESIAQSSQILKRI